MPPTTVRPADFGRDNAALCALSRRCPLGGSPSFYHQRDDVRERGRLQPEVEYLVAEEGGAVVGCGGVAHKPLWVGGGWQPTAYVFDLMVDPLCRGRGVARRLLNALAAARPGPRLVYAHVLDDNVPSRRLFEAAGFHFHRRRLLFHTILPRLEGRPSRAVAGPLPMDAAAGMLIDQYLRTRHEFVDTTAGHDGLFRLESSGGRGWAALRRHGPRVVVRAPWPLRALSRLIPFVPRPGRPVFTWSLHHLGAEGRRPEAALERVLRAAAHAAARQRIDLLLVPLFDDDPLNVFLRRFLVPRWGPAAGTTRLYVRGPSAGALLDASRPLLLSGRDG